MNQLQKALVEKIGHDFGFEYLVSEDIDCITLGTSRHALKAKVYIQDGGFVTHFINATQSFPIELCRDFKINGEQFRSATEAELALLFKRAGQLGASLPNQAVDQYELEIVDALSELPSCERETEVERLVRQRVGQNIYRQAMLDYWGNSCAVTGLQMPEVLKASHAKPWAKCESDIERLDVYNGFLLTANLDALFDRFLISFDCDGKIIFSNKVNLRQMILLGVNDQMRLRWISPQHLGYLAYHNSNISS